MVLLGGTCRDSQEPRLQQPLRRRAALQQLRRRAALRRSAITSVGKRRRRHGRVVHADSSVVQTSAAAPDERLESPTAAYSAAARCRVRARYAGIAAPAPVREASIAAQLADEARDVPAAATAIAALRAAVDGASEPAAAAARHKTREQDEQHACQRTARRRGKSAPRTPTHERRVSVSPKRPSVGPGRCYTCQERPAITP